MHADVEVVQSRDCLRDLCLSDGSQVRSAHHGMEAGGASLLADVGENVDETGVGATEDDEHAFCRVDHHCLIVTHRIDHQIVRLVVMA